MDIKYLLSLAKELRKNERDLRLAIAAEWPNRVTAQVDAMEKTVHEMRAVLARG